MVSSIGKIYEIGIPHNKFSVNLPDGTYYPDFITTQDDRPVQFLRHYDRVRTKPWDSCSFLDLGCSEGTTTLGLAQTGATVYGVEGRADGPDRGAVLRDILGFDRVHFSVANVNDAEAFRPVDGVFNAGILYHLDKPIEFLIRTCESARDFIYLDTGHAPANEAEMARSKFINNFGDRYTLEHDGLTLDVIDFAEPGDTRERDDKGRRRGPRSGIGNSNSVWLTHDSAIAFMAKMGFGHHEAVHYQAGIPRRRTCFFRTEPRPLGPEPALTHPLPKALSHGDAVAATMARDLAYLRDRGDAVTVIGAGALLKQVEALLKAEGVSVKKTLDFEAALMGPKERIPLAKLDARTKGYSGVAVLALPKPLEVVRSLVRLDRFSLALTSFGLALSQPKPAAA